LRQAEVGSDAEVKTALDVTAAKVELAAKEPTPQNIQAARTSIATAQGALGNLVTSFGDCTVTIPSDENARQVIIEVKVKHPNACEAQPPAGSPDSPWCRRTTTGAAGGSGDNAPLDPETTDALVYITVSHGMYYFDVGLLEAIVPTGSRTVVLQQRAGLPGDEAIALVSKKARVTGIALNLYPWGHRRGRYSGFEPTMRALDTLGLQLAVNSDLKNWRDAMFAGVVFEPVAGVALSGGLAALNGDFLRKGYFEGMSVAVPRSEYVETDTMLRFYFGIAVGYELLHTTASKLPTTSNTE
jgi:hypothetical protein